MQSLRLLAKQCILESNVDNKINESINCYKQLLEGKLSVDTLAEHSNNPVSPGWADNLILVPPESVPKRGFGSMKARVALLHAITHIEYNAINLAWDAVYRFSHMPLEYYLDWSRIAFEETQHFLLLRNHLKSLSYDYGDFPVHDGLWQTAEKTTGDVLTRMALVPRVLEARGLDVTPDMIKKFKSIGDDKSAGILQTIFNEEIGHVETGSYWFNYLCVERKIDPDMYFQDLINKHFSDGLRGPFNIVARSKAGFSQTEIKWFKELNP